MISREELIKSSEYWIEIIQNKIYSELAEFIDKKGISGKDIAETLGLSKGRISQILSGENLNFRLDTLVRLSLAIGRIPDFSLVEIDEYIKHDMIPSDERGIYRIDNQQQKKAKAGKRESTPGTSKRPRKRIKVTKVHRE